jgi:hypothetical protein
MLSNISCAAKYEQVRIAEHVCLFELAEKVCGKSGVAYLKIINKEHDKDIALLRCHGGKKEVYTCQD